MSKKNKNHASKKAVQNINLTVNNPIPHVDIVTSLMPTTTQYTNLKSLLDELCSANVSDAFMSKLSEYAGFFKDCNNSLALAYDSTTNNSNNPDLAYDPLLVNSQPNRSIDKLTFMIMFRIPFSSSVLNSYYGDPMDPSSTHGPLSNAQSWSYRVNEIRVQFSLKKLNAAGEQVKYFALNAPAIPVAGYYPVDDADNILGAFNPADNSFLKYCNENGYNYLGGILASDSISSYSSVLFNSTDFYKRIPRHFFKICQDENSYPVYNNGNRRAPHYPNEDDVDEKDYIQREVSVNPANTNITLLKNKVLLKDVTGYFVMLTQRIDITLKTPVNGDPFTLDNCDLKLYLSGLYARKKKTGARNGFLIKSFIKGTSGLTFGAGVDVGAGFAKIGYYKNCLYSLTVPNPSLNNKFKFYLDNVSSTEITSNSPSILNDIKDSLVSLIETFFGVNIVKYMIRSNGYTDTQSNTNYSTLKDTLVSVTGSNINPQIEFKFTPGYFGNADLDESDLFVSGNPSNYQPSLDNITISNPDLDVNPHRTQFDTAKSLFTTIMDKSFNKTPPSDVWITDGGISTSDLSAFKFLVYLFFGMRGGPVYVKLRNNWSFMQTFELGINDYYAHHLSAVYNELYKSEYYNKVISNLANNNNIASSRINELEKYVFCTQMYNAGNFFSNPTINAAIKGKDLKKIADIVSKTTTYNVNDDNRRALVLAFCGYKFKSFQHPLNDLIKKNLYRNADV